ncbi:hypothetical protein SAMN05216199_0263 [Pedococcus cremeus]|uniref:Uncharacterized protein n=1 Tax=Pedococcus cremeus TaxID=587636 RepID=A0A1H9XS53_9MICO|nr:hypothetical protein [Pedococcus cremeus]SES48982.1 hypothetical protein SAMN05216199_0263 [Pedococcus cremeus]
MTHQPAPTGRDRAWYEIRFQGQLGAHWAARFDGMTLTPLDDGTSVLHGYVTDQAALHGLLRQLGDLGITLLSLHQQESEIPTPTTEPGD